MKKILALLLFISFALAAQCQEPVSDQTAVNYYSSGIEKEAQENHVGAIADFDYAISLDPKYTEAYIARGISKWDNKDLDGAWKDFDAAISIDSTSGKAYYYRGLTYFDYRYYEKACIDLYQAILLGYSDAEVAFEEYCEW
ncbi:MAG: hypothetical protein A2W93_10105 [Bacteroidetes bacterium GWF2_43_63]|nr:MAG: hypothetical protein A2W94_02365 [Bacteroidetes bacterium GWE2_42_42]OFY52876.1 MAG: hypothetical protein A2W93_10105 [Bacteroidetes bacterium GWF2_43_63]HBG70081.1 hypothetical protein [Bacteroidales bacterium]HCB62312.1 hypothetical protein [Bacteroidales bacterium]